MGRYSYWSSCRWILWKSEIALQLSPVWLAFQVIQAMFFVFQVGTDIPWHHFLHKRNRTLIAIIILQYHRLFKIAQFSHCFPEKKNQQLEFLLSCWFLMWTSQGLNLGPPDYESVALTNWATSPVQWIFFLAAAKLDKNSDTAKCVLLKIWLNMDNCLILHGKSEGF